jgi:hypothetical protein
MRDLHVWCANITKTVDACFADDQKLRDEYRKAYSSLGQTGDRRAAETCSDGQFQFRALLVNVLTEPHVDHLDWAGGWTWLTSFGDYRDGQTETAPVRIGCDNQGALKLLDTKR